MLLAIAAAAALVGQEPVQLGMRLASYTPEELGLAAAVSGLAEVGPRLGVLPAVAALVPATSYGEGLVRVFDRLDEDDEAPRRVCAGGCSRWSCWRSCRWWCWSADGPGGDRAVDRDLG